MKTEPTRSTLAERVYNDVFAGQPVHSRQTKEEIEAKSDLTIRTVQSVMRKVKKIMLETEQKLIRPVRGVGYEVAHPDEAPDVIRRHQNTAKRSMLQGAQIAEQIDRSPMTKAKRDEMDLQRFALHQVIARMDEMERRQNWMSSVLAHHMTSTQDRLSAVEEALGIPVADVGMSLEAEETVQTH